MPFIAFYRKEYVEPELNIHDLNRVYHWDEKVGCESNVRHIRRLELKGHSTQNVITKINMKSFLVEVGPFFNQDQLLRPIFKFSLWSVSGSSGRYEGRPIFIVVKQQRMITIIIKRKIFSYEERTVRACKCVCHIKHYIYNIFCGNTFSFGTSQYWPLNLSSF